jgi:hypothetical protein
MVKRYVLILLMAIGAVAVGNEKVRTCVAFLIEVVKNIPEDSSKPAPDANQPE